MNETPRTIEDPPREVAAGIKAAQIPRRAKGFKQGLRCILGGARRLWATCGTGPVPTDLPLAAQMRGSKKVIHDPQRGIATQITTHFVLWWEAAHMAKRHALKSIRINRHPAGLTVLTSVLLPALYHVIILIKDT